MEWRPIPSLAGVYEASDTGLIRRAIAGRGTHVGRVLRSRPLPAGYLRCVVWVGNRPSGRLVHRLVAEAFLGPPPAGHEVNHKNLQKRDNRASNLEWITRSGNLLHRAEAGIGRGVGNGSARLTEAAVLDIRRRYRPGGGPGYKALGHEFGVRWETIRDIVQRRIWAWLAEPDRPVGDG